MPFKVTQTALSHQWIVLCFPVMPLGAYVAIHKVAHARGQHRAVVYGTLQHLFTNLSRSLASTLSTFYAAFVSVLSPPPGGSGRLAARLGGVKAELGALARNVTEAG